MSTVRQRLLGLSDRQKRELLGRLLQHQAGTRDESPCSWRQEQAWFLQRREPDSSRANLCAAAYLPAAILAELPAALAEAVARHEAMRTGFAARGGRAVRFQVQNAWLHPTCVELRAVPPSQRAGEIERLTLEELLPPFDLARPPLFRLEVLLLDTPGHLLFVTAHESVADAWSLQLLLAELVERAEAKAARRPPAVADGSVSYSQLVQEECSRDEPDRDDGWFATWRDRLRDLPAPQPLPAIPGSDPASRSVRGRIHTFTVPSEVVARLRQQAPPGEAGSFLLLPLLTAYAVWLHGLTGSPDFVVGIPHANRTRPEHQGLVAPLAGHLPIRFTLSHDPSFAELQGITFQILNEAFQAAAPPLHALVARLWPERLLEREPLFRFVFFLQELNADGAADRAPDAHAVAGWQPAALAARQDLALFFVAGRDQVVGRVEYAADLFSQQMIAEWFARFVDLLTVATENPERRISSLTAGLSAPAPQNVQPPVRNASQTATATRGPAQATIQATTNGAASPLRQHAGVAPGQPALVPASPPSGDGEDGSADREVIERVLSEVWMEVLKADEVRPEQSFFDLGGHSLLAMQVHSLLMEILGFEPSLRLQFDAANLRALANGILKALPNRAAGVSAARSWLAGRAAGAAARPRGDAMGRAAAAGDPLGAPAALAPASFNQQRLWFLDQLEPGSTFYNLHLVLRFPGSLHRRILERALTEIVRRHETLRTTFSTDDSGEVVQAVHASRDVPLPFDDLRGASPEERSPAVERLVLQEVHTPFDLARGPLLRARLLRMTGDEHLLVLVMHHIVVDAWSLGVLTRELQALYDAFAAGRPSPLPPLERQYQDFARWQRGSLQGQRLERLVTYWKRQLEGVPPVLELPTDRPRPVLQTFAGAMLAFELDPEVAAALAELGRRERATPFMLMLAAFAATLSRHARQQDVVVGSPIACRLLPELAPLIGFFTNTLVLRVDLTGDPSFTTLVRRVRSMTIDGYEHQELPLERLVDELQPARNLSHNPLFQVLFSFDSDLGPQVVRGGGDSLPEVHGGTSKFDLGLYTFNTERGLGGAFEYNTDLFDRRRIERLAEHFATLLRAAMADAEAPLSRLEMLSAAERAELQAWSRPATVIPAEGCAHELFARQAELFPGHLAASFGAATMTFDELDRAANRLAGVLRAEGVGLDVRVGLCVERSFDMLVALLGILKAGGAYVPIDPTYPPERIAYMIEDAAIPLLLTQTALAGRLPPAPGVARLCLDEIGARLAAQPETAPRTGVTLDHLVYTIYTSGSTGRPKGVAMTHRALADLVTWQARRPYFGTGGRTLQFTSLSFDVSFQEIFATWLAAGQMVLIAEGDRREPERLARIIDEQRVERLFQPFVALEQLCETLAPATEVPASLRLIVAAGEQLQVTPQIARTLARLPRCRLFNQYGPSETHIVTEEPVPGAARGEPVLPPIGKPVAGATAYVFDLHLQLQPAGVPGEIYIGGSAVARGYLNHPRLTAERFLPDPFCGRPGARMYRTGDLGRMLPGGSIQFDGRIDDQVKIRGFRVEPAEVESVFRQHPAVREAVVVMRTDAGGGKRLVAYYSTEEGSELPAAEGRDFLRRHLPEYMLPSLLLQIDALPLTPSGKINRLALPQPDFGERRVPDAPVAPSTPLEQSLADIFKSVLAVEQIGIRDSFFELGGHSLLATRVVARVREQLGIGLSVRVIFEAPSVAELALAISQLGAGRSDAQQAGDSVQRLESLRHEEATVSLHDRAG